MRVNALNVCRSQNASNRDLMVHQSEGHGFNGDAEPSQLSRCKSIWVNASAEHRIRRRDAAIKATVHFALLSVLPSDSCLLSAASLPLVCLSSRFGSLIEVHLVPGRKVGYMKYADKQVSV